MSEMTNRVISQSSLGGTDRNKGVTDGANQVNLVIAHSDSIVSAGLAAVLSTESDFQITLATVDSASTNAGQAIIITDYSGAMEFVRRRLSTQHHPLEPRVLVVTHLHREWEVHNALVAGVYGYILQNANAAQLFTAVRSINCGARYLSPQLSHCVVDGIARICLTSRETDVLRLLAEGQCNKSIARELGIGVGTVKTHVKGLFDKLDAKARTHAVVLAMRLGLVSEPHTRWQHGLEQ